MIFSIVEKENEHDGTQKILIKGSHVEIAMEVSNIIKEVLRRGFPEELLLASVFEAIEDYRKSKCV